jgi:hypothetical protein
MISRSPLRTETPRVTKKCLRSGSTSVRRITPLPSWPGGVHQVAGQGAGLQGDHGQLRGAGLHRDRDGDGDPEKVRNRLLEQIPMKRLDARRKWRGPASIYAPRTATTSREPSSASTGGYSCSLWSAGLGADGASMIPITTACQRRTDAPCCLLARCARLGGSDPNVTLENERHACKRSRESAFLTLLKCGRRPEPPCTWPITARK